VDVGFFVILREGNAKSLVFSCNSVWAPCGLFGCSFLGFGVFSVGFVG
jgi:hypothetical protein